MTTLDRAARSKGRGLDAEASRALQELLRARAWSTGSTTRPLEPTAAVDREEVRKKPGARRGERAARCKAGYNYGETTEVFQVRYEVAPATLAARHLPQHHRQRGARARPRRRGAQAGLPLFFGSYPITPASDILHELAQLQELRRHAPSRPRTRSRRSARRSAPRSAARSASPRTSGPGHRAQERGDRPGGDDRAAAGHRQRPARRPVAPACRPRPSRPTCCRRCSAATASRRCRCSRAASPGRLLRRARSRPCRIAHAAT